MGVGYHETRASNWGLETEIYQLEPYTTGCVSLYLCVCVCSRPNVNTKTYGESECCVEGIGLLLLETVHVRLNII